METIGEEDAVGLAALLLLDTGRDEDIEDAMLLLMAWEEEQDRRRHLQVAVGVAAWVTAVAAAAAAMSQRHAIARDYYR